MNKIVEVFKNKILNIMKVDNVSVFLKVEVKGVVVLVKL